MGTYNGKFRSSKGRIGAKQAVKGEANFAIALLGAVGALNSPFEDHGLKQFRLLESFKSPLHTKAPI